MRPDHFHQLTDTTYGRATKALSYLSAALCGISLLVFGAFLTVSAGTEIYKTSVEPNVAGAELQGELLVDVLFGSLIVLVSGVAFGRFLLRALPPQFSDRARRTLPRMLGAIAVCAAFIGPFIVAVIEVSLANAEKVETAVAKNLAPSAPFALLWASGAIGPLVLRHRKPRGFLDRPFVLFLRRFSTFSDRAVIALVLKQAAAGVPVVFLTPTFSRPRDWDPFVVGFAGLKLLHPWLSVPIVLRARDDDWQRAADELIHGAQTILLDISEKSPAVQAEVEMIEKESRGPDTVLLKLLNAGPCMDPFGGPRGACTIDYKKSWVRALPRIVIGLVAIMPTALLLSIPVPDISSGSPWVFIFIEIATASAYFFVCVRPTINREAKVALRTVLGDETQSRPAAALAYLFGFVTGIILLYLEPFNKDDFIRFHARQSIGFSIAWLAINVILSVFISVVPSQIGVVFGFLQSALNLAVAIFWVFLMYKACTGELYRIPQLADIVDNIARSVSL